MIKPIFPVCNIDLNNDRRNFHRFNSYKLRKVNVEINCLNETIKNGILTDISFRGAKVIFNIDKTNNTYPLKENRKITLKLDGKEILCTIKNVKRGFVTVTTHIDFGYNSMVAKNIISKL